MQSRYFLRLRSDSMGEIQLKIDKFQSSVKIVNKCKGLHLFEEYASSASSIFRISEGGDF